MSDTPVQIQFALISHTNNGKTTLARTLVGVDVGEVRDAAHVTIFAESPTLLTTPRGDGLQLWDTPGFGDSVRLLGEAILLLLSLLLESERLPELLRLVCTFRGGLWTGEALCTRALAGSILLPWAVRGEVADARPTRGAGRSAKLIDRAVWHEGLHR